MARGRKGSVSAFKTTGKKAGVNNARYQANAGITPRGGGGGIDLGSLLGGLFGGRIAEDLIYGSDKVSTGASQDIKQASSIARAMVTEWGFSEKLGPILFATDPNTLRSNVVSHDTGKIIDDEVKLFIDSNYQRALTLLSDNIDILHSMKDALMKYETIDSDQIDDLMARIEVREPDGWNDDLEVKKASEESEKSDSAEEKSTITDSVEPIIDVESSDSEVEVKEEIVAKADDLDKPEEK